MNNAATKPEADPYAFTLGDRMKKALRVSGLSRSEMAEYLDVAPETVSTWMNDRITPSVQTLRLWSLKTGSPYAWLTSGEYTPRDLNPEPTDSSTPAVLARVVSIDSALRFRTIERQPEVDSRRAA